MTTLRILFFGFLFSCLVVACGSPKSAISGERSSPQLPYRILIQNAETETKAGNFLAAANFYRQAYDQKPKKQDILFKAAELFTRVRDYRSAAEAYQFLQPNEDKWPLLGLQYGRALKQDGRYEQARRELALFLETYNGADRPIVAEIIRNELAGIALARQRVGEESMIDLDRPGRGINTSADEFGAVAIGGDQLYFTSTAGGQSRLYQSRLVAKAWTKATVPPGFPVIAEGGFGTGAMSSNGRAFFFTICSGLTEEDATNRCEIFRGERSVNGIWSQPEALNEGINLPGSNNAYPSVNLNADGLTQLYFASDRPGGRGGMDLYVSTQIDPANPFSFGQPTNLGPAINTVSDEITPAYDDEKGVLYFASNGHPGFGGQDVFRTEGTFGTFKAPENLGQPVNSASDDYGLSIVPGTGTGYITSNRIFTDGKDNTTETDIFALNFRAGRAKLKATVYDNTTGSELGGAEVILVEISPEGRATEIGRRSFPTGVYTFDLQPGNKYRVAIRREGYQGAEYQVETNTSGSALYGQPVFLLRQSAANTPNQEARPPVQGDGRGPGFSSIPPSNTPATAPNPPTAPAAAPAEAFRIQITATSRFVPTDGKYEAIRSIGDLRSEAIPGRTDLVRVTVGYFTDSAAAKAALQQVQTNGFDTAFVVRYDKGVRYGKVRL